MAEKKSGNVQLNATLNMTFESKGEEVLKKKLADVHSAIEATGRVLEKMASGRDFSRYYNTAASSIDSVGEAFKRLQEKQKGGAVAIQEMQELIKSVNAFQATAKLNGGDPSEIFRKFGDELRKAYNSSKEELKDFAIKWDVSEFEEGFRVIRDSTEIFGRDMEAVFTKINSLDAGQYRAECIRLRDENAKLQQSYADLGRELESIGAGNGSAFQKRIEDLERQLRAVRDTAAGEFSTFLRANDLDPGSFRFEDIFESIRNGSLTAKEAIAQFRLEYSHLLDGNTDGLTERLFGKFEELSRSIEEVHTQLRQMRADLAEAGIGAGGDSFERQVDGEAQAIRQEGEAISDLKAKSEGLGQTVDLIRRLSEHLATAGNGAGAQAIADSLTRMMDALQEFASVDGDKLTTISSALYSIQNMNGFKANSKAIAELTNMMTTLSGVEHSGTSVLERLAGINFEKLSNFKVSRASMESLRENLPAISEANIGSLERLAGIDWTLLSGLKIDKSSITALKELGASLAGSIQIDETALSAISKSIEDSIQRAAQNIKLTINQVELSADAEARLAKKVAEVASSGSKKDTGAVSGGVAEGLKEEAAAADMAAAAKKRDAAASKEVAAANKEVASSAEAAASAEKEMAEAGSGDVNTSYIQALLKMHEQLNVWIAKNGSAYAQNKEQIDMFASAIDSAISSVQGTIDGYSSEIQQAGTVTEETIQGLKTALSQITGAAAAEDAAVKAAAKSAAEDAKKQKAAVQEIVDLYTKLYAAETNKLNAAKSRDNDDVAHWRDQQKELQELVTIAEKAYPELAALARAEDEVTAAIERRDKAQRSLNSKRSQESTAQLKANAEELVKYQQKLNEINSWKGLDFMNDTESMKRWNEELEKTQNLINRLGSAEGKARIPIVEELKKQLGTLQSIKDEFNQVIAFTNQLNGIGVDSSKMRFAGDASAVAEYEAQIQRVRDAIENLRNADATRANEAVANVQKEISALEGLKKTLNDAARESTKMSADALRVQNLANQIDLWKSNNPIAYKNAKSQIDDYLNTLRGGQQISQATFNEISGGFKNVSAQAKIAGTAGKSFFQTLKAGWEKFGGWSIVSRSFMSVIRIFKQAVTAVKEVDAAMTELKKVTDLTSVAYDKFYKSATTMAGKVGAKLSDTINAVADFSRLGYSIKEATELAEASLVYMNIGDGLENISEATSSLISTMKAFGDETYSAMEIIDMFNEVGNRYAVSSAGIGEALQRSAAALATAGNSLEESIGLIVAANDVIQNPEVVGTSLKTLSMFYRSAKTEAEEAGIATEGMVESTAKLRAELLALTGNKLDIQIDDHNFKSTYQVLKELSVIWDDIGKQSEINQSRILEMLGGKRNANVLASIIKNFKDAEAAAETAANSTGSAWAENEKYLNSIEGKAKQVEAAFQTFANSVINSDLVKAFLDIQKAILDTGNALSNINMLLPTIVASLTIIKGIMDSMKAQNAADQIVSKLRAGVAYDSDSVQDIISGLTKGQLKSLSLDLKKVLKTDEAVAGLKEVAGQVTATTGATTALKGAVSSVGTTAKTVIAGIKASIASAGIAAAISLLISGIIKGIQWIAQSSQRAIDTAQEINEKYTNNVKTYKDNIQTLESLKDEYEDLNSRAGEHGEQGKLTAKEYQRYKEIIQEIVNISPSVAQSYSTEGAALRDYTNAIKDAIEAQEDLIEIEKVALVNKGEDTYKGARAAMNDVWLEFNKAGHALYSALSDKNPTFDFGSYSKQISALQTVLHDFGIEISNSVLFDGSGNSFVQFFKDPDNFRKLATNIQNLRNALVSAVDEQTGERIFSDEDVDRIIEKMSAYGELVTKYDSNTAKVVETLKAFAETSSQVKFPNKDDMNIDQLNAYNEGIAALADTQKSFAQQKQDVIAYTAAFSSAIAEIQKLKSQYGTVGEDGVVDFGDNTEAMIAALELLKDSFKDYPAITAMIDSTIARMSKTVDDNTDNVDSAAKSYKELAESMDSVSKAISFLEKSQSNSKDSFSMLKDAQEFVDAYNAILEEGDEPIDVGALFTHGDDGNIKWNTRLIAQYTEEIIRAKFENTKFAEEHPELVDALVAEATSFKNAENAAVSFAEALQQANKIADLNESIEKYLIGGSDADMLNIVSNLQEIVDKWNEIGAARAALEENGEEWTNITLADFLGEGMNDLELAKTKLLEFGELVLTAFDGEDTDNPLVGMLRNVFTKAKEATSATYELKDALSALDSVSKTLSGDGIDLSDHLGAIQEATDLADEWNAALKQLGREGEANKTFYDFLSFDVDGNLIKDSEKQIEALRQMYTDIATAAIEMNTALDTGAKAHFKSLIPAWVQKIIDEKQLQDQADELKKQAEEIKSAFSEVKDAYSYLDDLKKYNKGELSLFDMLESAYELAEKYEDIDLSQLVKWDKNGISFSEDLGIDAMINTLATKLKVPEEQLKEFSDAVKESFKEAQEAINKYEAATKSISVAGAIQSFIGDVKSGEKSSLELLSSAVSLAEDLGKEIEDIVSVDNGELKFTTDLLSFFDSYVDELVQAGKLNADLAAEIKEAARSEGELADEAARAADNMSKGLNAMSSLSSLITSGLSGDTSGLELIKEVQSIVDELNEKAGSVKFNIFDFIDFDASGAKPDLEKAKAEYSKLIDQYVNDLAYKMRIDKGSPLSAEEIADLEALKKSLHDDLDGLFDPKELGIEDLTSQMQSAVEYLNSHMNNTAVGDGFLDAIDAFNDLKSKFGDAAKDWTFSDFFQWDDQVGDFVNKTDLLTEKSQETAQRIVDDLGLTGDAAVHAKDKIVESLSGISNAYEELNGVIDKVKNVNSYNENIDKYNRGEISFLDMLSESVSVAEKLGLSLDEVFDFYTLQPNAEAVTDALDRTVDDLISAKGYSKEFANQLKAAARAAQQTQQLSETYKNVKSMAGNAGNYGRSNQLTYEDYNAMIAVSPEYAQAVEYVNGKLTVNRDRYNEITAAMAEQTAQTALLEAAQRKLKYEKLEDELRTRKDLTDDVRASMQKEIDKLKLEAKGYMVLANEISNATNQFERFRAAAGDADAPEYMDAQSALKMINDVMYNTESELYGRYGNEKFQEAIRLLVNPEIDFNDPAWMQQVQEAKERLEKYFGEGTSENPQTSKGNMSSFWKDLLTGNFATVTVDETGRQWGQLNGTVEDIAKSFGMTKDAVRAALQELQMFSGVNFDWEHIDPEYYQEVIAKAEELAKIAEEAQAKAEASKKEAEDARAKADEAAAKLEEAKKSNDQDAIALAEAEAAAAEQNAQAAERAKQEAEAAAEKAAESAAESEQTSTDALKKSLEEILAQIEEIQSTPIEMDFTSAIESSTAVVEQLTAMVEMLTRMTEINQSIALIGETTGTTQAGIDELSASVVDVDEEPAVKSLESVQTATESAQRAVIDLSSMYLSLNPNPALESIQSVINALAVLAQSINNINSMTISPKSSSPSGGGASGGVSSAGGTMSAPGGRTLVGELGREIVVDVDTGRWYTVGNNGPEFVNLPRHAIVFNHTKTAELLGDKMLDMRGVSMASGTKGNSGVGGGMINLDAFTETQKEESKKTRQTVEEVAETLEDKLDAIKEAYELANKTLEHLIQHEEFSYYKAERGANYDKMHTYLANEVEIYKSIMANSQKGIEELKRAGADDGSEQLQELEEAYWSAYRSMYEVLDNIRNLYTDALSEEVDSIQSAFKNLTDAAKEYNTTGRISIDTFQQLLEGGVEYLGLLKNENGEFDVSKNSIRNLLKLRKDQLAVETAIAYVSRLQEALRNGEAQKVNELVGATGQIGRNTWSIVYANLEVARSMGLTNEQYQAALKNIQNLQALAAVAMDDFDSDNKIAEAKENFEALRKEIEHYIKHQDFSFTVGERALNFTAMNQALNNEVNYYKRIMTEAQATISEMIAHGATDTDENLQAVEEAYWSAYKSMYDTIDKINALRVDALSDRLNGLTGAFNNLKKASEEYNQAGGISLSTFQTLLSQGFEYMSLLDEENGRYVIAKERISQYVEARKNQLAIESALSYIAQVREALENKEEDRLQKLLKVQDMVSNSTWSMVYAQAALLRTSGLTNEQYETLVANLKKMQALADSVVDVIASGEEDISEEYEKQQEAMQSILEYTEDLIRAETNDQIDAIREQIDAYKEIIDLKKKSIDETKKETEYQDSVAEKVKAIAELQAKADMLGLDTSRNAQVERQKILNEIAEKQKDLAKYQGDYAIDAQKEALDKEYEDYEKSRQDEIEALEKSISSEEKVYQLAIARIRDQWETLYQDLIAWNTEEGSVINQEITDAWEAATRAVQKYGSAISALDNLIGNKDDNYIVADIPKYHSGGQVGSEGSVNDHEVLAVLEKGELVINKPMKKALYTVIDFVKELGDKLGASVSKLRNFSAAGIAGQMTPAFAAANAAPVTQNNNITFSPNISVAFNGVDINGRDATSFGRDVADAAADNLFEAFNKRGINAIRTLRQ